MGNLHIPKDVATCKHETTDLRSNPGKTACQDRLCGHVWQLTFRWFMRLYEFVNCHGFLHGLVTDSLWIRYYWKVDGPCIPKCQLHFQHVMSLYDIYIYIYTYIYIYIYVYMINSMFSCIGFNTLKNCQVLLTFRNL